MSNISGLSVSVQNSESSAVTVRGGSCSKVSLVWMLVFEGENLVCVALNTFNTYPLFLRRFFVCFSLRSAKHIQNKPAFSPSVLRLF